METKGTVIRYMVVDFGTSGRGAVGNEHGYLGQVRRGWRKYGLIYWMENILKLDEAVQARKGSDFYWKMLYLGGYLD